MNGKFPLRDEYTQAAVLMEKLEALRHIWMEQYPPPPVKRGDMKLLGMLMEGECCGYGPPTIGGLAQTMKQSVPGISQRVAALEEDGYVCRTPGQQDRRQVMIELTNEGRALGYRAMEHMLQHLQATLQALGEEKSEQLLLLLDDLNDVLTRMPKENTERGGRHT